MATMDSPRQTSRRAQLQKLIDEAGNAADLARVTGTPKTHISAILAGRRGIGDQLAAKLESIMGKPVGWMDQPAARVLHYPSNQSTPLQTGEPAPAAGAELVRAVRMLALAVSKRGKLDRRQLAVLLPLLAEEPEMRQDTSEAIIRLLDPAADPDDAATWEDTARKLAAELAATKLTAAEFVARVDKALAKGNKPMGAASGRH